MQIDWQNFTPWSSLIGGACIGLASVLSVLLLGKIAGVSGVLDAFLQQKKPSDWAWRLAFILGLLLAPWLYRWFATYPQVVFETGTVGLVLAGILVGFGTRLGSGCTSGHGISGLSRLSLRSLVAVLCFMGTGFLTVWLTRQAIGG